MLQFQSEMVLVFYNSSYSKAHNFYHPQVARLHEVKKYIGNLARLGNLNSEACEVSDPIVLRFFGL